MRCYSRQRRPWFSRSSPRRAELSRKMHRPRGRMRRSLITRGITRDTAGTPITGHRSTTQRGTASRSNLRHNFTRHAKRGAGRLPFLSSFAVSAAKERIFLLRRFRRRRAPHARCDQQVICSKPGGVIRLFPWLVELTTSGVPPCITQFK